MGNRWKCGICEKDVGKGAIAYIACRNWIHFQCKIKTGKEAKDPAEKFLCPKCNDSVPSGCGKDGVPVYDVPSVFLVADAPSDQGGVLSECELPQAESSRMDESENENVYFVLEVSDVLTDKRNIQLLKRKLVIAEGFIHPTPGNIYGNENEVCMQITKTFDDNLRSWHDEFEDSCSADVESKD